MGEIVFAMSSSGLQNRHRNTAFILKRKEKYKYCNHRSHLWQFYLLPQQDILMIKVKSETFLVFYLFICLKGLIPRDYCVHTHTHLHTCAQK